MSFRKTLGNKGKAGVSKKRGDPEQLLRISEERLRMMMELSSGFYWEQDEDHRFTWYWQGNAGIARGNWDPLSLLGKTSWELEGTPVADGGKWDKHLALREAREPFSGFLIKQIDPVTGPRYISISGRPVFDEKGKFKGYRGIAEDITGKIRAEQLLRLENTIIHTLAKDEKITEALEHAIQVLCELENWEAGYFWKLDESAGVMRFELGWAAVKNETVAWIVEQAKDMEFAPGAGLPGTVWRTGDVLWIPDIVNDPRIERTDITELTGWNAAFLFPVIAEGRFIGVLDFYAARIPEPDERLLQVIRVLGAEIGHFYQRVLSLEQLRESEARFRSLTELSSDWYWEMDTNYRFSRFEGRNTEFIEMLKKEFLGRPDWEINIKVNVKGEEHPLKALMDARGTFRDIIIHRTLPDGSRPYISISGEPVYDKNGNFTGYRGLSRDISERKQAEERIQYLATHDGLTGLPNRIMFSQLLNHAIQTARRYERRFSVLFIDLDRFKLVNDTLGHQAGDTLLIEMSERLRTSLRASDVIARLGGDEFVILVQEINNRKQVATVARNLLSTIHKTIFIADQEYRITASIGICMYPDDALDELSIMKNADMAMYLAKEEGKNNYQFYSGDIKERSIEKLTLETNLRKALERNEFSLHYQAKVELNSGDIRGVEALLRWNNAELGSVSPAYFIPFAEDMGLIVEIGRWVLRTACSQAMDWRRQGLPPLCMAVNLSPRQFSDPNLIQDIAAVLKETGMPPELLELEITESMVMHNTNRAVVILKSIKQLGLKLAIDDFGTGYSSLAQLKRFPIDTLKVDRSFIREIPDDMEDRAITEAIIAMAKTLGLTVIAEGVETAEQQSFLSSHACDEMQGFYFSKPLPAAEFAELLRGQGSTRNRD